MCELILNYAEGYVQTLPSILDIKNLGTVYARAAVPKYANRSVLVDIRKKNIKQPTLLKWLYSQWQGLILLEEIRNNFWV